MLYFLGHVRSYILVFIFWPVVINHWNGMIRLIQLYAFGYSALENVLLFSLFMHEFSEDEYVNSISLIPQPKILLYHANVPRGLRYYNNLLSGSK